MQGLGHFHVQARPAIPALLPLLNDPDCRIWNLAADALDSIDPQALQEAGKKIE